MKSPSIIKMSTQRRFETLLFPILLLISLYFLSIHGGLGIISHPMENILRCADPSQNDNRQPLQFLHPFSIREKHAKASNQDVRSDCKKFQYERPWIIAVAVGLALIILAILVVQRVSCNEPLSRALYFWRIIGPIVAHYKFTAWWLKRTDATKEHRDEVYKCLHDRYCQPAHQVLLDLKGMSNASGYVCSIMDTQDYIQGCIPK